MTLADGNLLVMLHTITSIPSAIWSAELWWLFVPINNTTTWNIIKIINNFEFIHIDPHIKSHLRAKIRQNGKKKLNNMVSPGWSFFFTFGLMPSSSPFSILHNTCSVQSPPIPKLREFRGAKLVSQAYKDIQGKSSYRVTVGKSRILQNSVERNWNIV